MDPITRTKRATVARYCERGVYEREAINAIIDEALICHVGYNLEGQPYVIPTTHARIGDRLYLHGSVGSRMLRNMKNGIPVCVTVTLLDGLVLARSAMHHSMNYRSAVVLGVAQEVTEEEEKRRAMDALVNHVVAGRAAEVRRANDEEMRVTSILSLPIAEASAKVRQGPPIDDEADYSLSCWAGVLPLQLTPGTPVDDPRLTFGTTVPRAVAAYERVPVVPSVA